jgi:KUP system potassium uptake protein
VGDDEYIVSVIATLKEITENEDEIMVMDSTFSNRSIFVLRRLF